MCERGQYCTCFIDGIQILADKRGITLADMMSKIKINSDTLTVATANIIGEYQAGPNG